MSVFHPVDELIATASRDYFVRIYDFDARIVAKFDGVVGDVVWLDWAEDGQELVALSDTGTMTRWPWAAAHPTNVIGPGSDEHSGYAPAAPNGGNDGGQAIAPENRHTTPAEVRNTDVERLVIDAQKSLLACISDGTLAVWDISAPTPTLVAATTLPDDVWARSCAFAGTARLVFGASGAGYRTYDYLLDQWQTDGIAPPNGISAMCVGGSDITRP
jgi:WD40 repeat protein